MGLREGQVTVLIHSGSRGLAIKSATTILGVFKGAPGSATASSCPTRNSPAPRSTAPRGRAYLGAMRAAANYAWCNRQFLTHQAREVFARRCSASPGNSLGPRPRLRRGAQHRQVRDARRGRRLLQAGRASTARGRPGPSRRATPRSPTLTRPPASPSSSPAAWGRRAGCSPVRPAAWSSRSARPATARAA